MSDLKDMYQERAEEIAFERYECGFYDLDEATRDAVYEEAMNGVVEDMCGAADFLRKSGREQ